MSSRATDTHGTLAAPAHLDHVVLGHGGGGQLTQQLLQRAILPRLSNPLLDPLMDSAILDQPGGPICFTTDGFVVQPLEFPGGDIGRLAVCGTVNDLAVMGARPLALSLSLVIEEGLLTALLERIMDSLAAAADQAGVHIATGDTKVIERAHGDGLIITTAGIGQLHPDWRCTTRDIVAGDCVIVTGHIAEHGLAVMSAREGLAFQTTLRSDVAPLNGLVDCILGADAGVKFMRDPTRSGIAGVLADLAEATDLSIEVNESSIPITPVTRHTAEMLGIDPLEVANEGKIVLVAPSDQAEAALEACRRHELGRHAAVIGRFVASKPALVELITPVGGRRLVQRPHGEQLPRIC